MSELHERKSFDRLLDALLDIERRNLLVALAERTPHTNGPVDLSDTAVSTDSVTQRIELQHVHLPKLADYGLIHWNEGTTEVAPGPAFDEIRPLVVLLANHEDELPPDCL